MPAAYLVQTPLFKTAQCEVLVTDKRPDNNVALGWLPHLTAQVCTAPRGDWPSDARLYQTVVEQQLCQTFKNVPFAALLFSVEITQFIEIDEQFNSA